jgi:dihydrofolate reductase
MLRLIAAIDSRRGIANEHGIPWQGKIPTDSEYFGKQTEIGVILMGYGTYEEFDAPLHDRENFVVVRPDTAELRPGFVPISDAAQFFAMHSKDVVWVIGGAALFAISLPLADELFLTQLDADFRCTKFFPKYSDTFELERNLGSHVESDITYHFEIWQRSTTPFVRAPSSAKVDRDVRDAVYSKLRPATQ